MKRGINKKAISPLIATVLIIGFTIALAVIVMDWGQRFSKNIQEQTEETTSSQITCATDVIFDIQDVCIPASGQIKIRVVNNGIKDIDGFIVRSYQSDTEVEQDTANFNDDGTAGVTSFDVELSEALGVDGPIRKVEAIPKITVGGSTVTCANNVESFGDEYSATTITKACS